MALVDDPKEMILRMLHLQAREGGETACQAFPTGRPSPSSPFGKDDVIFGVFEGRYLFSHRGMVDEGKAALAWTGISRVFTTYSRGKTFIVVEGFDGTQIRIPPTEARAHRIFQLIDGLAKRWSVTSFSGLPAMSVEDFFAKAVEPADFASNLYPEKPRPIFREAFLELRGRECVADLKLLTRDPEDEGEVYAEAIAIVSNQPESYFEPFLQATRANWMAPLEANDRRKLGLKADENAWIVSWN